MENKNTHEVQEIVEILSGLDLDDECSSSIMEGTSNAPHEHTIEVSILLFSTTFFYNIDHVKLICTCISLYRIM